MKKVDIRKIYVGEIAKQSKVSYEKNNVTVLGKNYEYQTNHSWTYESDIYYGLFKKVLYGLNVAYKHILTDTTYFEANYASGNHYVVIPESIEKLTQKEVEFCSHLISKNKSFNIDIDQIQNIEEHINEEHKCSKEDNENHM